MDIIIYCSKCGEKIGFKKDVGKTKICFYCKKSKNKERAKKRYYDLKSLK